METVDIHAGAPVPIGGEHLSGERREPAVTEAPRAIEPDGEHMLETRFGPVPLDPDRQIRFRGGLPGFPAVEWFQLDPIPGIDSDLLLLQAVDVPGIGFITLPLSDEIPVLRPNDLSDVSAMLDIAPGELLILAIVTLATSHAGIEKFLNLRAPLFVDVRRKLGAQVVLADATYPLRYRLDIPST